VTASEVASSRGLIACVRASVGDTRYALCTFLGVGGTHTPHSVGAVTVWVQSRLDPCQKDDDDVLKIDF